MADNKIKREASTRETQERKKSWTPPETLPSPDITDDDYAYRWIRVSSRGTVDATNVSSKLREGWEPVKAVDHPEITMVATENDRFADNVVMGGLMLCKAPKEMADQCNAHYRNQADSQMASVDNNLMRENDPRMPLFNQRDSKVTFGNGN